MLGKIVDYNEETKKGVINCGTAHFQFSNAAWKEQETPQIGDDVFFNQRRNKVLEVHLAGDYLPKGDPVKSKLIAGLLGIVFGVVGAGRIYLGYYKMGILQCILSVVTLGVGVLWPFVDGVLILMGQVIKDAEGRPLK